MDGKEKSKIKLKKAKNSVTAGNERKRSYVIGDASYPWINDAYLGDLIAETFYSPLHLEHFLL